mmetsp:Transcript_52753/g.98779  ORF Transcript_52753/g.98779 Transcript_52753/m.98779 type:complete len:244 (-) Transcript_52753:61-792(-)
MVRGFDRQGSSVKEQAPKQLGAHIGDPEELVKRLQKKWNGSSVIEALKIKLKDYEARYGVFDENQNRHGDKELAILQKVVEDGEVAERMQPSEEATLNVLKRDRRDYIDFALDELGRHARVVSTVTDDEEFAWSKQGDPDYNPCLKCSEFENAVGDDMDRTSPPGFFYDDPARISEFGKDAWWFTAPPPGGKPFSEEEKRAIFDAPQKEVRGLGESRQEFTTASLSQRHWYDPSAPSERFSLI